MSVDDAIRFYDELLRGEYLESSLATLDAARTSTALLYEGRLCVDVLRPQFFSSAKYREMQAVSNRMMEAMVLGYRHIPQSAELQRLLDVTPEMLAFDRNETSVIGPMWHRLDGFIGRDGVLRFLELNTRPGGALQNDALADLYERMPVMDAFRRRYRVTPLVTREHIERSLQPRRAASPPRTSNFGMILPDLPAEALADVDFTEVTNYPILDQPELTRGFMTEHGGKILVGKLDDFTFANGRLLLHGEPIEILAVPDSAFFRAGPDHPTRRAIQTGAARLMLDYVWEACASNKIFFEILTDAQYADVFGRDLYAFLQEHVPWTRAVADRETTRGEERIDLLSFVLREQESLVLKPSEGEMGQDIVLGWRCSSAEWTEALGRALQGNYVVQARVDAAEVEHPIAVDGALELVSRVTDFSPFVWEGAGADGAIVRMDGGSGISNLGSGGTKTTVFLVD